MRLLPYVGSSPCSQNHGLFGKDLKRNLVNPPDSKPHHEFIRRFFLIIFSNRQLQISKNKLCIFEFLSLAASRNVATSLLWWKNEVDHDAIIVLIHNFLRMYLSVQRFIPIQTGICSGNPVFARFIYLLLFLQSQAFYFC